MWWACREAPPDLRRLFPESGKNAWLVQVPAEERDATEPYILRWQPVHSVRSVELSDQSVVYCGDPEDAIASLLDRGVLAETTRDREARVHLEYPTRYETLGELKQAGIGHTLEWTRGGVSFTTQSPLKKGTEVTLRVDWPVRLASEVKAQLRVRGRISRAESKMAVMAWDELSFGA